MEDLALLKQRIDDLFQHLSGTIQNLEIMPQFSNYLKKIKSLSGMLTKYTTEVDGKIPTLTEDDYKAMLNTLTEMSSERQLFQMNVYRYYGIMGYWPNYNLKYWRDVAEIAKICRGTFLLFDISKQKPLKQMYEEVFKKFVLDEDVKVQKISSFPNKEKFLSGKKVEFTYVDEKNNKVDGYLQVDKGFVILDEYNMVAGQIAASYPTYAEFFEKLAMEVDFTKTAKELKKLPKCFDVETNTLKIDDFVGIIDKADLGEENHKFVLESLANEEFKVALFDFSRRIDKLNKKFEVNVGKLAINGNESLTQRTSAVTKVAKLLGLSDVIPEAKNIKVEHAEQEFNAVFEKKANGIELGQIGNSDEIRLYSVDQFLTKDAKKAIAKLQILDFITGNVNRDKNKLFLEFDKTDPNNPKLKNIQGISNKSSFTNKNVKVTEKIGNMPSLANLKVIDEETAHMVFGMSESMLKNTLQTFNLSKDAIDEAWNRCQNLQKIIAKGRIYDQEKGLLSNDELLKSNKTEEELLNNMTINIVKDDDWDKLQMDELVCTNEKDGNYFDILNDIPEMMKKPRERNTELNKDLYIQDFVLNKELMTISKEMSPLLHNLRQADKTFFKKNHKCDEVFKKYDDVINGFAKQEFQDVGFTSTEFVALLDMNLISIQASISKIKYEIQGNKDFHELSHQDRERVAALDIINTYIREKMDIFNKKYGDKEETNILIKRDERLVDRPMKVVEKETEDLSEKLKFSLEFKDQSKGKKLSEIRDLYYNKPEMSEFHSNLREKIENNDKANYIISNNQNNQEMKKEEPIVDPLKKKK